MFYLLFVCLFVGRVINISSIAGFMPLPFSAAYCISKCGVEMFSQILRREIEDSDVKVIVVEPADFIASTMLSNVRYYFLFMYYLFTCDSDFMCNFTCFPCGYYCLRVIVIVYV